MSSLTMEIVLSLHALRATILSSVVQTLYLEMTSKFSTRTVLAKPLKVSKFGRHFYVPINKTIDDEKIVVSLGKVKS